jgi:hypothetical protein
MYTCIPEVYSILGVYKISILIPKYLVLYESGLMELELHVVWFFKNSKMAFQSFKKFGTKNLDIDNNEIY